MFDYFADTWDNYRSDPNVLIIHFEELKRVSTTRPRKLSSLSIKISAFDSGRYRTQGKT